MTPKNLEELVLVMRDTIADFAFTDDNRTLAHAIIEDLDAAGLAIVPKEPTPKMYEQAFASSFGWENKGWEMSPANCYRAMLEASPYRGKDEKTAR